MPAVALAVPLMLSVGLLVNEPSESADTVRVGALARDVTLNALLALPPAVVTVTVPVPAAAVVATLTGSLIEVALTVAVPPLTPELLKLTVPPLRFAPVMVTVWLAAPCTRVL